MSASMPRNLMAALSYALEMISKILIPDCRVLEGKKKLVQFIQGEITRRPPRLYVLDTNIP